MEFTITRIGTAYARLRAAKGMYIMRAEGGDILKITTINWTSEEQIRSEWVNLTAEEKAEIEALREEEEPAE